MEAPGKAFRGVVEVEDDPPACLPADALPAAAREAEWGGVAPPSLLLSWQEPEPAREDSVRRWDGTLPEAAPARSCAGAAGRKAAKLAWEQEALGGGAKMGIPVRDNQALRVVGAALDPDPEGSPAVAVAAAGRAALEGVPGGCV